MMNFDKKIIFFLISFIVICIINCLIHEKIGPRFNKILRNNIFEFLLILFIGSGIFLIIPHFFFDDAGFILRYMDNFRDGYFFRFNIKDSPVYGISGFLHGLFTGTLCWLHITYPEQALWVSNFLGFIVSGYFLFMLLKILIKDYWLVLPLWLLVLGSSKMFLSVASCGLETPFHMAIILSSIYFLIAKKDRLFFLMSALSIASKLDAVPVVGILFLFYLILNFPEIKINLKKTTNWFIVFFILPLGILMLSIYFIFGTILPQSAYSKLYHHAHPSDHWFPFLQYFTDTLLQRLLLIICLVVLTLHFVECLILRTRESYARIIFGTLFISSMILYYFYNPAERMMWYYAMPEMFMVLQIIYSFYYFISTYIKSTFRWISLIAITCIIACHTFTDVYYGLNWVEKKVRVTENERRMIGEMLGHMSTPDQTLLSGHGLISRHFKGYVLDASGLNSKVVTDNKRKMEPLIIEFAPDYIIHHASADVINICNQFDYELTGVYRDISIGKYPSWILLQRSKDLSLKHELHLMTETNSLNFKKIDEDKMLIPNNGSIVFYDDFVSVEKTLHIGLERKDVPWKFTCTWYVRGKTFKSEPIEIPAMDLEDLSSPSSFIVNQKIPLYWSDSIQLESSNPDFKAMEPIYELAK